jgi:hypothetical protein
MQEIDSSHSFALLLVQIQPNRLKQALMQRAGEMLVQQLLRNSKQ